MDREQADKWCEKGIIGLVLAILVFAPLATGAVRTLEWLVVQALTMGAVVLWLVRVWLKPAYRLLCPPVCWAVLAFIGYAAIRYYHADVEYVARQEFLKVLIYGILFFLILENLHSQDAMQMVVTVLVFLAMAISIYAIYQFVANSPYVWHFIKPPQYMKRGSGTYICPNHLAGFLEMVLPLALSSTLLGRFKPTFKVFLGYAAMAILAGIGVSLSRGGWIASGLALIVLFTMLIRNRTNRIPALCFLVLLLGAGFFFINKAYHPQKRFSLMFEQGKVIDVRFQLWKPAIAMWKDHFWWGAGPAHFDVRFRTYRPEDIQMRPLRVHNDYLNTLADWGLVGSGIIATALVLLGVSTFKTWKFVQRSNDLASKGSNRSSVVFGAMIGLFAILLHSLVDFNMHIPANAIVAVTLMALLAAHVRFSTERYWISSRWTGSLIVTMMGLAALVYLAPRWWLAFREYQHLRPAQIARERAANPPGDGVDYAMKAVDEWKQAHSIEPMNPEPVSLVGEFLLRRAAQRPPGFEKTAAEALRWFEKGARLNPFDPYNHVGAGVSLHLMGNADEAEPHFDRAVELDPRGYYTVMHKGWHFFNVGEYESARAWFQRSLLLSRWSLSIPQPESYATSHLRRIAELTEASQ